MTNYNQRRIWNAVELLHPASSDTYLRGFTYLV